MNSVLKTFEKIYDNYGYDRINNPDRLNVKQLSPIGVKWKNSDNSSHEIINNEYKIFSEFYDYRHIAIIQGPFEQDININNCYILDIDGNVVFDFRKELWSTFKDNLYYFSDIYKTDGVLFFLVVFKNTTYKFQYDIEKKLIFNFSEIKW